MKTTNEVTACVVDYGSFISLAERLAETMAKVYYYSPFEQEYRDARDCVIGDGLPKVERLDDYLSPESIKKIDFYVFPDIGYGGHQRLLKQLGKAVWGSMGASDLELYRTRFLSTVEKLGLPVPDYKVVRGLTALSDYLKTVKNKWVKVNRYRENMETWKHLDHAHSVPMLRKLATEFGGVAEKVVFVVMEDLPDAREIGYDGWNILGEFPESSFQGYEKKNELYLGSMRRYEQLPEPVRLVNEKFSGILREYGYCNFWATEIRLLDGVPYFIDPTARMPGQTGEQLLETCDNLPEVMWAGANGEVIKPVWRADFAAEATLHYTGGGDDWKTLCIPDDVRQWTKLYHYCMVDGRCEFPPHKSDEVGVLLGTGDSIEAAYEHLLENLEKLKELPLSANTEGFADLLTEIQEAEKEGMEFTDQEVPGPELVLDAA